MPKGSKTRVGNKLIENADMKKRTRKSGALAAWMRTIAWGAKLLGVKPIAGPVEVQLLFYLPRPKTVRRALPEIPPDVDKLTRAALDALEGIAYKNDAQIVSLIARKLYAGGPDCDEPGVNVYLKAAS